jgi:hypothetical protein
MAFDGAGAAVNAVVAVHVSKNPFRNQFLPTTGKPPIPWGHWIVMLEDWLMASGFPDIEPLPVTSLLVKLQSCFQIWELKDLGCMRL